MTNRRTVVDAGLVPPKTMVGLGLFLVTVAGHQEGTMIDPVSRTGPTVEARSLDLVEICLLSGWG